MAYSNGHISQSLLARIVGNGWLLKEAAESWNAMAAAAKKDGVDLSIWESSMRRTYRPFSAQEMARAYWCGQGRCGNAAVPGTSNHGLAITVDLMSLRQRQWIDRHGAQFGWSKSWSDAAWEWWHIKFNAAMWRKNKSHLKTATFAPLRHRSGGSRVQWVQRRLRAKGFMSVPGKGQRGYGYFGETTVSAVKRFQRAHNLTADGIVGKQTWRKLAL